VNQTPTGWPELTNANGVQISSMLFVRKEKAMGSWMIADPLQYWNAGSPHWRPGDSIPNYARTSQDCGSSTA
jgi:hypothetical protein